MNTQARPEELVLLVNLADAYCSLQRASNQARDLRSGVATGVEGNNDLAIDQTDSLLNHTGKILASQVQRWHRQFVGESSRD